jgi:tetratricopeptide (TPR) repeat protein
MWPMWMAQSQFQEGSRWLEAALAAFPAVTPLRAEGLRAMCGVAIRLGRAPDLIPLGNERVEIFRKLGDRTAIAHALDEVGVYQYMLSNNDTAERLYDESLVMGDELGDPKVAAAVLHSVAVLAHCRGDFAAAREALLESLSRLRAIPAHDTEPFFRVHTVGLFVAAEGPGGAPRMYYEETVQTFRRVNATRARGYALAGLGITARAQGLAGPARERLLESLAHFRETRDPMGTAFVLNCLGNQAGGLGECELGREWLEEALALRRELGDRRAVAMTLRNLGALAVRAGEVDRGTSLIREALALFEETDDVPGQMGMRLTLGTIAADAGDHDQARELLTASLELAEGQILLRCAGWTRLLLAEIAIAEGDRDGAARLVGAALDRLRPLGDRWGIARCLELDEVTAKRSLSAAGEG